MQVYTFFQTKFANFRHITRLSTINHRKVINIQKWSSFFGPPCKHDHRRIYSIQRGNYSNLFKLFNFQAVIAVGSIAQSVNNNNKTKLRSAGYSALPLPPRLMRRACSRGSADRHTDTHRHRRRAPQYLLRSLSNAAKIKRSRGCHLLLHLTDRLHKDCYQFLHCYISK